MQSIFLAFKSFYISISLASSGSFTVKNDNIHSFFSLFWLQILNLPASLQNKNKRVGPFSWKRSVLQNPDRERTIQSTGICLRLGLPYNNFCYFSVGKELENEKSESLNENENKENKNIDKFQEYHFATKTQK